MIYLDTWKKAWALLDARERRNAWIVLGALASAAMVASAMPFLAVLAEPPRIETTPSLVWAYYALGFKSVYGFLVGLGLTSFAVIVLSSPLQIAKIWAVVRFATMRMHSISLRLLANYLSRPHAFFLNWHTEEIELRILNESPPLNGLPR